MTKKRPVSLFEEVKDEIRKQHNIKKLSDKSGVSIPAIYAWLEDRVESPREKNLRAVAEALGFEIVLKR